MSTIAYGVRAALSRIKGTQTDKAIRLGVSPTTLRNWKSGVVEPTEENLARIARLAGVEQEWIRSGGVEMDPAE